MADKRREQRLGTPPPNAMPEQLRVGLESMSGLDLADVRVQSGSTLPASVSARAYTRGQNIHLAPGQDHDLAHESWHIVQQAPGGVQTTTSSGAPVNADASLEREAGGTREKG